MSLNVTDKRHQRTKQISKTRADFTVAALQLLRKYPLNKIGIDMIVQRSGYSRQTFYRHFGSVIEIVRIRLTDLVFKMFADLRNVNDRDNRFYHLVVSFFEFRTPYRNLLETLQKQDLLYLLRQITLQNIQHSKLSEILGGDPDADYLEYFGLSGMFSLLEVWLEHGCDKNAEGMGKVAQKIKNHLQ